jgi:hypothetical protein
MSYIIAPGATYILTIIEKFFLVIQNFLSEIKQNCN